MKRHERTRCWASRRSGVQPNTLVIDTGALIGFERGDRFTCILLERAVLAERTLLIPAGVLAQVWRNPSTQVRLGRLLGSPRVLIKPLDDQGARAAGQLCAIRGTRDIVDASVVATARQYRCQVVTSDADDLRRLDPSLALIEV
jgi:hypothetical protein